ncbi:MAG: hypothetical protein AAGN82_30850 [Myxococcota bacterium]
MRTRNTTLGLLALTFAAAGCDNPSVGAETVDFTGVSRPGIQHRLPEPTAPSTTCVDELAAIASGDQVTLLWGYDVPLGQLAVVVPEKTKEEWPRVSLVAERTTDYLMQLADDVGATFDIYTMTLAAVVLDEEVVAYQTTVSRVGQGGNSVFTFGPEAGLLFTSLSVDAEGQLDGDYGYFGVAGTFYCSDGGAAMEAPPSAQCVAEATREVSELRDDGGAYARGEASVASSLPPLLEGAANAYEEAFDDYEGGYEFEMPYHHRGMLTPDDGATMMVQKRWPTAEVPIAGSLVTTQRLDDSWRFVCVEID